MKPSPSALATYELHPQEWSLPLQGAALFGREAEIAVEVGFGGGEYLNWWAGEHPQRDHIGIELPPDCIYRGALHLEQAGRSNVRLIRGDARYLLRELFAPSSLDHVLMQFPMPWPKEKHAKHRVSSPEFAATLARVLMPGCCFELVTDQEWYARETDAFFRSEAEFQVDPMEVDPERPFRTRYERKWLEEGRSIYRLLVRLQSARPVERKLKIENMECLHLPTTPKEETLQALAGRRFRDGDRVGQVKEVFRSEDGWLLRLLASDESFSQLFHARLRMKDDGRCVLKIDEVPRPYYTHAVRQLLASISEVLKSS